MRRARGFRFATLLGVMALGAMGGCCDNDTLCGDGIVEEEQCEQDLLGGADCAAVVPGSVGTLGCTTECTYDTTGCLVSCGNGILDPGEECDCGENVDDLPDTCLAINGAADTSRSRLGYCALPMP